MEKSGWFVVLAIAAIILGISLVAYNNQNKNTKNIVVGDNALIVNDQPSGNIVTIDTAMLARNGFVVIRKSSGNGPGALLAVSPILASGENKSVFIPVSGLSKGTEYFAVLYGDDGNNKFEESDEVLKDKGGQGIQVKFKVY